MYRVNKKRSQAKNDVRGPSQRGTKVMMKRSRPELFAAMRGNFQREDCDSGFKVFKVSRLTTESSLEQRNNETSETLKHSKPLCRPG
jgi:hypothetical protein